LLTGFAAVSEGFGPIDAALVLAGPNPRSADFDPEGPLVLNEVIEAWAGLPYPERRRIHIVNLPMVDREENAAMVNALQRHAAVIVQKSACAGFGLSVSEAMWKGRPVVGSAVGGISGQIEDGESGLLIHDRTDVAAFGRALRRLLEDPDLAQKLGEGGRQRALEQAFGTGSMERWNALLERLDAEADRSASTP
jgi:trehalose synthase